MRFLVFEFAVYRLIAHARRCGHVHAIPGLTLTLLITRHSQRTTQQHSTRKSPLTAHKHTHMPETTHNKHPRTCVGQDKEDRGRQKMQNRPGGAPCRFRLIGSRARSGP
eukprot:3613741-Rhodomonas_salina.1